MKNVLPKDLNDNFFKRIGEEYMLITVTDKDGRVNTMTAGWGGVGVMWWKPICVGVIRPQRYTNELAALNDRMTFTFFGDEKKDALKICGTVSGRDCDKIALAGLKTVREEDYAYFDGAELVLVCKKIYVDKIKEDCFVDKSIIDSKYPNKDFHTVYVCEIEKVLIKD